MSVDESWVANDTFTNVGRKVFFGKVEPDHPYWLSVFGYDFDGDGVKVIFSSKNTDLRKVYFNCNSSGYVKHW